MMNRLALGTVQFGTNYGIANTQGQVRKEEVEKILDYAHQAGVNTLDTAIAYGDSEKVLGSIGVKSWNVISKLPLIPETAETNVKDWIIQSVDESLQRLQISKLYGLLLHKPEQLLGNKGEQIYEALTSIKNQGLVQKIGVSIYSPQELENIYDQYSFDLVQAPFNVIDARLLTSGWLSRLKTDGVEVHVRSLFLQGLLLMDASKRPQYFNRWQNLWEEWEQWLKDSGLSKLEGCLGYVVSNSQIDRFIVGVDNLAQLQQILVAMEYQKTQVIKKDFSREDKELINPSLWRIT